MDASALPVPAGLAGTRLSIGPRLLRLRSDEQLLALFRAGHDEAFRTIHDRYRDRLFAYARQMLAGSRQDAEDALQDIFVRAYAGLRASDRNLALRAWLYRVAHNRCIDELRRPCLPPAELLQMVRAPIQDPMAEAERRESLRRLLTDIQRLPTSQRSALLMRELGGMSYEHISAALDVSLPAVKSLLVRARVGLAAALAARDTACSQIREELMLAHDRGVRPSGIARSHMRDCPGCREFRAQIRSVSSQFAALLPALGPVGLLANLLGLGGVGGGAGGGAAAGGAVGTGGAVASAGALGAGHMATLLAAAVVTAGSAVEIQHTISVLPRAPAHIRTHTAPATPRRLVVSGGSIVGASGSYGGYTAPNVAMAVPIPKSATGSTLPRTVPASSQTTPRGSASLGAPAPGAASSNPPAGATPTLGAPGSGAANPAPLEPGTAREPAPTRDPTGNDGGQGPPGKTGSTPGTTSGGSGESPGPGQPATASGSGTSGAPGTSGPAGGS